MRIILLQNIEPTHEIGPAMTAPRRKTLFGNQNGQVMAGWVVGLFIIAAMLVYVTDTIRRSRNGSQSIIYRELALNVAKAGFEDGMSFFRTNTIGTCLTNYPQYAPTNQATIVTPWPQWPDAAFLPGPQYTDEYSAIAVSTPLTSNAGSNLCAGAIIRNIPMNEFQGGGLSPTSNQLPAATLWGRYVIRRQNTRNWSPGLDTAAAQTDPDACHDLSAIETQAALGGGTLWSIVSHGYLMALPQGVAVSGIAPGDVSDYAQAVLATPALYSGNCLLSPPLGYYNGQRVLLAQARVYGEISRINFNLASAAIETGSEGNVSINLNGIVQASGSLAYDLACTDTVGVASSAGSWNSTMTYTAGGITPSLVWCFPGQTPLNLQRIAQSLSGTGKVMGFVDPSTGSSTSLTLPVYSDSGAANQLYQERVAQPSFYYINHGLTLVAGTGQPVLSGLGMAVIQGGLVIQAGNTSSWAGILFVRDYVNIRGPASITGILICPGPISIGMSGDFNRATVSYSSSVISDVENLFQDFTVLNSSIIATQF
jgi:hypothetical protein